MSEGKPSADSVQLSAQDLIDFEKQLSQFDKDTLTTYIASLAVDWTEDQQDAFIQALCMIEAIMSPKKNRDRERSIRPHRPGLFNR